MIEQRQYPWKRYQNHHNSENYNTWRNTAELADASLLNDKINKVEQMCTEDDAASKRNDTKELFIIVKKLNGVQKHHHLRRAIEMMKLQLHLLSY